MKEAKGFTLIELIIVIAILGIIAAIAIPQLSGFKNITEERVCTTNRKTVERFYNTFLLENEHRESTFNQFLIENFDQVCPGGGVISYDDEEVKCSLHDDSDGENDEVDPPEDEVPWL